MLKKRKKKIASYPLGGLIGGKGDPTVVAKKDVMSVPGAVTQTAGNTGAPVVDPYNFAFEAGVTTLTPQQWNLLSAMQKQAIQHQAYSKAGLKQTGDNTFTGTQGQANMFKKGGPIGKEEFVDIRMPDGTMKKVSTQSDTYKSLYPNLYGEDSKGNLHKTLDEVRISGGINPETAQLIRKIKQYGYQDSIGKISDLIGGIDNLNVDFDNAGEGITYKRSNRVRPHYNPVNKKITLGRDLLKQSSPTGVVDNFIEEFAHQVQINNPGIKDAKKFGFGMAKAKGDQGDTYDIKDSPENLAHNIYAPALRDYLLNDEMDKSGFKAGLSYYKNLNNINPVGSYANNPTLNYYKDNKKNLDPNFVKKPSNEKEYRTNYKIVKDYYEQNSIDKIGAVYTNQEEISDEEFERVGTAKEYTKYKKGGKLPKYANGGDPPTDDGKKGIKYVTDPNRVKAYQDSLNLHNRSLHTIEYFKNSIEPLLKEGNLDGAIDAWSDIDKGYIYKESAAFTSPYSSLTKLNGIAPKPSEVIESKYDKDFAVFKYKKPTQPVALAKTFGDINKQITFPISKTGLKRTEPGITKPIKKGAQYPRFSLPSAIQGEGMRDIYEYNPKTGNYLPTSTMSLDDVKNMDIINKATTESMRKDIERFLPTNNQKSKSYKEGGELDLSSVGASVADTALGFIPGVGPILSGLGIFKGLADQNNEEEIKPVIETAVTQNPYGNYKMGGKLNCMYGGKTSKPSVYLKAMSGGSLDNLGNNVYLAKGNAHLKGGIQGDTNADGNQDIEFEGNELYDDTSKYIINKDIAKPYTKLFKGLSLRKDNVSTTSANLARKDMIVKNEINRQRVAGKSKTMLYGGETDPSVPPKGSQSSYGSPSMFNLVPESYFAGAPMSQAFDTAETPYTTAKVGQESGLPMTTGDAMQLAGSTVAPLVNLTRGLLEPAEQYNSKRYANPYESQVLSTLGSLSYNEQPILNSLDRTFAAGKETIDNSTSSAAARRSNLQGLYTNLGQKRAEARMQGQQLNNSYRSAYAEAMANMGQQKSQSKMITDQFNTQSKGAKDNLVTTGLTQVGQGLSDFGKFKNQQTSNNMQMALLNELTTDYGYDTEAVSKLMKAGFTKEEIIKYLG